MLGHWPPLYPEELIYSGCARYAERTGSRSSRSALIDLFGSPRILDITVFPRRLRYLVDQLPSEFGVTSEDLIGGHTILPFFRLFFGSDLVSKIAKEMLGELSESYGSKIRGVSAPSEFLRYCPCCVEEDRRHYKETYWRRLHQIGNVHVCPIHLVYLNNSTVRRQSTSFFFVSAEKSIPALVKIRRVDPKRADAGLLLWLAEQSLWLINQRQLSCTRDQLVERYRYQLSLSGLLDSRGFVVHEQLCARLAKDVPHFLLPSHVFNNPIMLGKVIHRLLRKGEGPPSLHLLLIRALGLSVKDFSSSSCVYFENGPWPCLNPVGHHSNKETIKKYQKEPCTKGMIVGVFSCRCGYTYSRVGPDLEAKSRNSPARVLATGSAWELSLSQQWIANRPITKIAKTLNTTQGEVKKVVRKLGLPFTRNGKEQSPRREAAKRVNRVKYRDEVVKYLDMNPSASRAALLAGLTSAAIDWLRNNDLDWFHSVWPPAVKQAGPIRRVDWAIRDLEFSARVPTVKSHLLSAPGSPRPVTATQILWSLGLPRITAHSALFPKTIALANVAAESREECAVRRLKRFVVDEESNGRRWTFTQFLRKNSIRKSWLGNPLIIRAIAEAGERITIDDVPSTILNGQQFSSVPKDEAA
jgi:hypothetical protein